MSIRIPSRLPTGVIVGVLCALATVPSWAANPKQPATPLDEKAFFRPDLYISTAHAPLEDVLPQLSNRAAWERFFQRGARTAGSRVTRLHRPSFGRGHQPGRRLSR